MTERNSSTSWKGKSSIATPTRPTTWRREIPCSSMPTRRTGPRNCWSCRSAFFPWSSSRRRRA